MKKHLWGIIYGAVLAAFTLYVLTDTFMISRVYSYASSNEETAYGGDGKTVESTAAVTDNSYSDGNISITVTEQRKNDTTVYIADIRLSSADYLKTALAENSYGKNVTAKTSEIAESNNAILAINGDYYGVRENGYVLRNGELYRDVPSDGREGGSCDLQGRNVRDNKRSGYFGFGNCFVFSIELRSVLRNADKV